MPIDGGQQDVSAFSAFRPTALSDVKASFVYNPNGAINGAPIPARHPKPTSGVVLDDKYGGPPKLVPKTLFNAIKALLSFPKPVTGTITTPHTLGAVPPSVIPPEATKGSVIQFYAQDGHGSMLGAPINNNALTGVYTK